MGFLSRGALGAGADEYGDDDDDDDDGDDGDDDDDDNHHHHRRHHHHGHHHDQDEDEKGARALRLRSAQCPVLAGDTLRRADGSPYSNYVVSRRQIPHLGKDL